MHARNMEFAEQHDHVTAYERDIEIARSRSVMVERLVRSKLVPRYRAPAENYFNAIWCCLAQDANEFIVALGVVGERELSHAFADCALAFGVDCIDLSIVAACFISHEGRLMQK